MSQRMADGSADHGTAQPDMGNPDRELPARHTLSKLPRQWSLRKICTALLWLWIEPVTLDPGARQAAQGPKRRGVWRWTCRPDGVLPSY